jgi:protein SCO1/2
MMSVLLCSLLLAGVTGNPQVSRLAVIRPAPDFALVDQANKEVKLSDLKGKVLLVSFVFTTCNGSCPATTHRMANIQKSLEAGGKWDTARVQFLSITLDPARDTSPVLQNYMKLYDLPATGWAFLTGPPQTVARTIESWGMWVKAAENGQLDHPSRIFLLDGQHRIREIYNIELLKVDDVVQDIRALVGN